MPSRRYYRASSHSTILAGTLKFLIGFGLLGGVAFGQPARSVTQTSLREELACLLADGRPAEALRRAQAALRDNPRDPGIRQEYIELHLALARTWLAQRRFADCTAALEAIRAVAPGHPTATEMLAEITAARRHAGEETSEVERLLRLELYEAALDRIRDIRALRPDLAGQLQPRQRAARLGVADDHYLARNFNEAFALYESLLADNPDADAAVHSRWVISLALALSEGDFSQRVDPNAAGRLLARALDVLKRTREPILGQIIGGLLAERSGHLVEAGRAYAQALGTVWELPPADQRRARIGRLRRQAVTRARELYQATPVQRRCGFWAITVPDAWKHRRTTHFDVYARNDLVAERVAEAAEYHYAGLRAWLGTASAPDWQPRCELRVHATQAELHRAAAAEGITFAVSHTRLQGEKVLLRTLHTFQADPWLLSSTLPHELTHLLIAEMTRDAGPPLAIDEGLALHAEPAARRLMYRLRLDAVAPTPAALLAARQLPSDVEVFYAEAGALTGWLLDKLGTRSSKTAGRAAVPALLDAFRTGVQENWWRRFGLPNEAAMTAAWRAWHTARRAPHRMPLMIRVEPSPEYRKQPD